MHRAAAEKGKLKAELVDETADADAVVDASATFAVLRLVLLINTR